MEFNDYTTEENEVYSWSCEPWPEYMIEPPHPPPEDERDYFFIVAKSIRFGPQDEPAEAFQAAHTVSRPDFFASAAITLSDAFSAVPWGIPAGLINEIAPRVRSQLWLAAESPRFAGSRVIHLELLVCGPRRRRPRGGADRLSSDLDRALRESTDEISLTSPASKEAIESLEEVDIFESSKTRVTDGENCDYTCSICLEDCILSSSSNRMVRMPCSHMYHKDCIVRWLKTRNVCPLCRYTYTS